VSNGVSARGFSGSWRSNSCLTSRSLHFNSLSVYKKPDPCVKSSNKTVAKTVLPKIRINIMSSCDIFFSLGWMPFDLFLSLTPRQMLPFIRS